MQNRSIRWLTLVALLLLGIGHGKAVRSVAQENTPPAAAPAEANSPALDKSTAKNVVLWISVDGFRGDYVDRGESPFLESLMRHGAYTRKLTPVFPSLTFPNHVSQATGVEPGVHGIVSNTYFDTATGQQYNFPGDPNLLQAEPIWLTAARQGVRAAALDWPFSHAEEQLTTTTARAAYFHPKYDPGLSDAERLEKLVELYRTDASDSKNTEPLQLLMAYVHDVDSAGHKAGPDAVETVEAIRRTDRLLRHTVEEAAEIFKQRANRERGDAFYVLITTDHGMAPVKTLVNLRKLIGRADVPDSVVALSAGSTANIYLNKLAEPERERIKRDIVTRLKEVPFAKYWTKEELPPEWNYAHGTRTGDLVVSLDAGYDFSGRGEQVTAATDSDAKALKGMHGYDPAKVSEMLGFMVLIHYGAEQPGFDLGEFHSLRLHPTVAKLLEIEPSDRAKAKPMEPIP